MTKTKRISFDERELDLLLRTVKYVIDRLDTDIKVDRTPLVVFAETWTRDELCQLATRLTWETET